MFGSQQFGRNRGGIYQITVQPTHCIDGSSKQPMTRYKQTGIALKRHTNAAELAEPSLSLCSKECCKFTARQSVRSSKVICLLRADRTDATAYHSADNRRPAGRGRDRLGIDMHPQSAKGCRGTRAPLGLETWRRRSNSVITRVTPSLG